MIQGLPTVIAKPVNELLIIAASRGGAELGRRLRDLWQASAGDAGAEASGVASGARGGSALPDSAAVVLAVPQRYRLGEEKGYEAGGMAALWREHWESCRAIIFIGAAGIAVRMLAPLLEGKFLDPAVVVIDESGGHAISLLSGHWGGGNDLTREVAALLGADPVITTASDTLALPAFDVVARQLGLAPVPFTAFAKANGALVNGDSISVMGRRLPGEWPEWVKFIPAGESWPADGSYRIAVGHQICPSAHLVLVPKVVFAGIGCRRGVAAEEVEAALVQGLAEAGCLMEALAGIASITIKEDESGLLAAAAALAVPLQFYPAEELAQVDGLHTSDFVRGVTGCAGVSEQAAFLASGRGQLILRRQTYGRVTVALAVENSAAAGTAPGD